MKNKVFAPVPVSERFPEKTTPVIGIYENSHALLYVDANGWWWKSGEHSSHPCPLYWLEEREDRTAELVEMLRLVRKGINATYFSPLEGLYNDIDELITSIEKGETK